MKSAKIKIGVVILNFNGTRDTIDCLQSILLIDKSNIKLDVIVVDNNSEKKFLLALKKKLNQLRPTDKNNTINIHLIENQENFGFSKGNNIGIKSALRKGAQFVLILNNDTTVEKNLLKNLVKFAKQKKPGIFGPKIYFEAGLEFHHDRYLPSELGKVIWYAGGHIDWLNVLFSHRGVDEVDKGQFNNLETTDFVSGCAMFISSEILQKIGLFDERYFVYLEDVDLCMRAKKAGYQLWFEPKAVLWHKNARSSGKPGSAIHIYYQTRNRLLFGFSYSVIRAKLALFKESILMLFQDELKRKAVFDFYTNHFGKM